MNFQYFEAETHVATYNKFRPSPPDNLVEKIVSFTAQKISEPLGRAIDVGCGSGQSTEKLAEHFQSVYGLDPSLSILLEATKRCKSPNITFRQSSAEKIGLESDDFDLITVGQAVQWFDLTKFYAEANRLLRRNGVIAVYGYKLPVPVYSDKSQELSNLIQKYYSEVLGEFVFHESKQVHIENYKDRKFNDIFFIENGCMERHEGYVTEFDADITDISGYISSLLTFQNYSKGKGDNAAQQVLQDFESGFTQIMGTSKAGNLKIQFHYFLLLGRKM